MTAPSAGDPAFEADDLAFGALCGGGVELDRVVVCEVADCSGKLRDRRLARDDLGFGGLELVGGAGNRNRDLRMLGLEGEHRELQFRDRAGDEVVRPAVPRRGWSGRARSLAATLEAMHDRRERVALGDEPPRLRCREP